MNIDSNPARFRAYKILGLLLERYLTSGVIEIELLGEPVAVVAMVKAELLKIQREIASNNFDSPRLADSPQPVAPITNKSKRQRRRAPEGQST